VKIILLKDIKKVGKKGESTEVKEGYACNYLIPRGFALVATKGNFKKFKEIESTKKNIVEKEKQDFLEIKKKIKGASLTISAEAKENDELYGAISEVQIIKLLDAEGISLKKGMLVIEEPIKKIGVYNIKVNIYPQVEGDLRIWVVKK